VNALLYGAVCVNDVCVVGVGMSSDLADVCVCVCVCVSSPAVGGELCVYLA